MYEFNQKNFEKYFFYGIDNRDELLEGIIFFTNKDLNTKYLNIMDAKKLPSLKEKFEEMIKSTAKNYEQIYKFIDLVINPSRADIRISEEEKRTIRRLVEDKIKQLDADDQFTKTKRAIFCKFENKFMQNENWVKQIYDILMRLNYLEKNDYIEYYDKWLQTKVNRLDNSGKYEKSTLQPIKDLYNKFKDKKKELERKEEETSK